MSLSSRIFSKIIQPLVLRALEKMPRRFEKRMILDKMMKSVRSWKLPDGDYLEFGTYDGTAFVQAHELAQKYDLPMRLHAFDSFEGLPQPNDEEAASGRFCKGQYACSLNEFKVILERNGINEDTYTLTPGFFEESLKTGLLNKLAIKRAAIVWIDCDLYESTVPVLDFISDIVTSGTFLVFDDWFSFGGDPDKGEIKAVNEWLNKNKNIDLIEYDRFHTVGKVFLVHKR